MGRVPGGTLPATLTSMTAMTETLKVKTVAQVHHAKALTFYRWTSQEAQLKNEAQKRGDLVAAKLHQANLELWRALYEKHADWARECR